MPLENAVINAVRAKIMDDAFVEYVADAVMDIQSRESSVLPALRKQLEEAERGITNVLNAIQMGIINASTKQRLDELEERKKDVELQIIQVEPWGCHLLDFPLPHIGYVQTGRTTALDRQLCKCRYHL